MEIRRSEKIGILVAALAKAGLEFGDLEKDEVNHDFLSSYTDLATELKATKPALNKEGIAVLQFPRVVRGVSGRQGVEITTMLCKDEEFLAFDIVMPAAEGDRFDCQTIAKGVTYGRRISYESALCIRGAEPDDDGNALRGTPPPNGQRRKNEPATWDGGKQPPQSERPDPRQMKLAVGSSSGKFAPAERDGGSYAL
jgi:hypothetical protein